MRKILWLSFSASKADAETLNSYVQGEIVSLEEKGFAIIGDSEVEKRYNLLSEEATRREKIGNQNMCFGQ